MGYLWNVVFATTVNYLDRQVLSLTWKDFIAPEFHWTDSNYGDITAIFSIVYAIANLFAGRFIDWMGTKKGYLWAIFIWSAGACLHALCGWATEMTIGAHNASDMLSATGAVASTIAITSVYYFIAARIVLGAGEAGNFPAAIKVTAEYFPKKDRAFSTSIFNAGSTIGALIAPVSIPPLARYFQSIGVGNGWEMAFVVIGGLGFIWMGLWMFLYKKPHANPHVNAAELAYIEQDNNDPEANKAEAQSANNDFDNQKISFLQCFKFPQTWAVFFGKFMTDGVWWFYLFWTPAYISDVYGFSSDTATAQMLIFVLYAITMLSIYGGKLPTIIINKTGKNPYVARMQAMFILRCSRCWHYLHSRWATTHTGSRLSLSVLQEPHISRGRPTSIRWLVICSQRVPLQPLSELAVWLEVSVHSSSTWDQDVCSTMLPKPT